MGAIGKLFGALTLLGAIYVYLQLNKIPPVPKVEEKWWGPGEAQPEDPAIKPFKINVPDEVIEDLQYRLKNAIPLHPPLEGVKHHYGLNTELLETFVDYWKNNYNWTKQQEFLNQFPQFQTSIQGLKLHFIHVKPKNVPEGVQVLPILLLNGWVETIRNFYELIPLLTTPQKGMNFVFEVVAPSLPGYGFSEGPAKPGLGPIYVAQIVHKLMQRLNLNRYYTLGTTWGIFVVHDLAILYPDNIIGVHRVSCTLPAPSQHLKLWLVALFPSLFFNEKEVETNYPLSEKVGNVILETGYLHLQATKPDSVGVALRDSPVGLAAYLLEKFITWTDVSLKDVPDGGLTKIFTFEQLLDNVMIFWVTRSATTAIRIYAATFNAEYSSLGTEWIPVTVPSACNRFTHDLMYLPESLMREHTPNLIHLTDLDGGTFPSLEVPDVLAKDMFEFVQKVQNLPREKKEL